MSFWNRLKEMGRNVAVQPRKPVEAAKPVAKCRTCGVAKPEDNQFCSDGFHAPTLKPFPPIVDMKVVDEPVVPSASKVMRTSKAGIDLMHQFEGCEKKRPDGRFDAYLCPAKVWTIGWGSTGKDPFNGGMIRQGTIWTREQCDLRFDMHLEQFEEGVREGIGKAATSQSQFDAMVCLAYNIGVGAFKRSTVLRKHVAGDYEGAAHAFGMWVKAGGKTLKGLVRRREAEASLYLSDSK